MSELGLQVGIRLALAPCFKQLYPQMVTRIYFYTISRTHCNQFKLVSNFRRPVRV